jgi:hypothetical protein
MRAATSTKQQDNQPYSQKETRETRETPKKKDNLFLGVKN